MIELTNKEILEKLENNHGDIVAFARFCDLSVNGLKNKLKSKQKKDELAGQYTKFVIKQKDK